MCRQARVGNDGVYNLHSSFLYFLLNVDNDDEFCMFVDRLFQILGPTNLTESRETLYFNEDI